MRLRELTNEQLRDINVSGLSQRQVDELKVELLMRILSGKRYSKVKAEPKSEV